MKAEPAKPTPTTPRAHRPVLPGLLLAALALASSGPPAPVSAQTEPRKGSPLEVVSVEAPGDDELRLVFRDNGEGAPNFLAQFRPDLSGGAWSDLSEATFEALGGELFAAQMPSFGLPAEFFRVIVPEGVANDPLQGDYVLGGAAEVLMLWGDAHGPTGFYQKVLDFVPSPVGQDDQLVPGDLHVQNGADGLHGEMALDAAAGDFDGDGVDDVVGVFEGPGGALRWWAPQIDAETYGWDDPAPVPLEGASVFASTGSQPPPLVRTVPGYFDPDPEPELIVGYSGADGMIHLRIYDMENPGSPVLLEEVADEALAREGAGMIIRSARWDVAAGDLDADGSDEVILVAGEPDPDCPPNDGCWRAYAKVYDFDPEADAGSRLTPWGVDREDAILFRKGDRSSRWLSRIAVAAGEFDHLGGDEIAVGYEVGDNSSATVWELNVFGVAEGLAGLVGDPGARTRVHQASGSNGYGLDLQAADMDADGRDELVYAGRSGSIYAIDDALVPRGMGGFTSGGQMDSRRFVLVADLDADHDLLEEESSEWRPEIVVATDRQVNSGMNPDHEFLIRVYGYRGDPARLEELVELEQEVVDPTFTRNPVLVGGDFGDNGIRLGIPRRSVQTEIVRPLVILNAPPTHFDVFDGEAFDINFCYGNNDCDFQSSYTTSGERSVTVSTVFHDDWVVGAKAEGGFTIPVLDVGVKAELRGSYGEGFSRFDGRRETVTITATATATADDQIYAATVDYEVWEYPLLVRGEIEGYVTVVRPEVTAVNTWADTKSFVAQSYVPLHETGNILSYREVASPEDNPNADDAVRNLVTADTYSLSGNSDFDWELTREGEEVTSTERSRTWSIGSTVSFDIPFKIVPNVEVSGDYAATDISTETTTVTDRKGLAVHLGGIDLSSDNTRFRVTPYTYFAKTGALVLDFAAQPELAAPGFPETWWQKRYGRQPDPAFNLPRRYDNEKGDFVDAITRNQSKDILFDPEKPRPGEVVRILARINNYSLLPTTGRVRVRFYVGDPDGGDGPGTPIVGEGGETFVTTGENIPDRGSAVVEIDWRVPADIDPTTRIYAVADPDGAMAEIHEDNNKGWNVLRTTQ